MEGRAQTAVVEQCMSGSLTGLRECRDAANVCSANHEVVRLCGPCGGPSTETGHRYLVVDTRAADCVRRLRVKARFTPLLILQSIRNQMKREIYTSNTLRGDVTLLKFDAGGNLKFCTDVHQRKTKQSRWPDASAASNVDSSKAASWQKN